MTESRFAYVSIVCSKNYLPGLVATFLSLKRTGTEYPMFVLIPQYLSSTCGYEMKVLKNMGLHVIEYSDSVSLPQELIDRNLKQGDNRFSFTFDKLKVFGLTQFDKIVFVDSDIYVLQSLDNLFGMPHMSAMVAGKSYPGNEDWVELTSGIMTIVPQEGLLEQFQKLIPVVMKVKPSCGDQDILQAYYSEWTKHPELDMGEKYGVMASYATYYETVLGYHYTNDVSDPKAVAIIHYAGEKKPWMQHWSFASVIKQELILGWLMLRHRRNTKCVFLEYNKLVRKAKRLLKE